MISRARHSSYILNNPRLTTVQRDNGKQRFLKPKVIQRNFLWTGPPSCRYFWFRRHYVSEQTSPTPLVPWLSAFALTKQPETSDAQSERCAHSFFFPDRPRPSWVGGASKDGYRFGHPIAARRPFTASIQGRHSASPMNGPTGDTFRSVRVGSILSPPTRHLYSLTVHPSLEGLT